MAGAESARVEQRIGELLALGSGAADALGARAGRQAGDALALLERIGASASELLGVNVRLVPLLASLQRNHGKGRWWRRFTGAQFEYDLNFDDLRDEIELLAGSGEASRMAIDACQDGMRRQYDLMAIELALLATDVEAARLLATPAWAARRESAGIGEAELARLARRADNLDAMATATALTRAQFKVALQHARTVSDRYREIQTLLLPVWRQSVGFDLFNRQTNSKDS